MEKQDVDGQAVLVEEEIVYLADRSAFAGTVTTMDRCLRNAVRLMDVPIADALRMVATTPAAILRIMDRKGILAPGRDADVVVLSPDLQVTHTITAGRLAYSSQGYQGSEFDSAGAQF